MKKHTVHAILTIFVVPILMFGYAAVSPGNTFSAHAATAKKVVAKTKKKAVKIAPATKKSKKTPIVKKQAAHKDSKISETPTKKRWRLLPPRNPLMPDHIHSPFLMDGKRYSAQQPTVLKKL